MCDLGNVPYQLFIEDFAQSTGLDSGDSGEWVVSLVSLILMGNLSGKLILGLCADLSRGNSSWLYSSTVALGGVCVICIPLSSSYLQLQFISFFLGFFRANWTLTAHAVSRLVPVSQFDEAHGVLLLFGGVAVVVGPRWQSYDVAFFVSGACMVSGSLVLFTTLSLSCLQSATELSSKAGPEQSSSPTLEPSRDQLHTGADEPQHL
uniref:Solute carrier family 40 protein n=1 Tax=Knipowitschia caucasica TaxID=637954 RepID=A0AAV2KHC0_KNICA